MNTFRLLQIVRLGAKNLLLHKLRSGLTMLGIIFGVCSVIAMLAIGEGASYEAQEQLRKLGRDNIIIHSVKAPAATGGSSSGNEAVNHYGVTYRDAENILESIPGVLRIFPLRLNPESARFDQKESQVTVVGTLPAFFPSLGYELIAGRFLTSSEQERGTNVCVLSQSLAERIFLFRNPLGKELRVGSNYYTVVGVVADMTFGSAVRGDSGANNVYIPLSTSIQRIGELTTRRESGSMERERVELHQVTIQMKSDQDVEHAVASIQTLLKHFHPRPDYEIVVPLQLLRQAEQTKRIFSIVLGSIAAISLLVGGIGIMNIMLATVTERTREIGIRRALGAKRKDIITQFLVETVVLSVGGGILGVIFGVIIPILVSEFTSMVTIITPGSLVLAFGISAATGVLFGIYPAKRAAQMDPIEALRHE